MCLVLVLVFAFGIGALLYFLENLTIVLVYIIKTCASRKRREDKSEQSSQFVLRFDQWLLDCFD